MLGLLAWQLPVGWHQHRYLAATAPLLLLTGLAGLDALRSQTGLGKAAAAALFGLWSAFGLATWPWQLQRTYQGARLYAVSNRNAALALQQAPPGPVLVADAGLLTYYSGRTTVDLLGITDHAMSLAQAEGRGAVLEALLHRKDPPLWAALHEQRPDVDLGPWLSLGLLKPMSGPALGEGLRLYRWDRHDAPMQSLPDLALAGAAAGALNIAGLDSETAHRYRPEGPRAAGTRALNRRLPRSRAQVPEGGREVLADSFSLPQERLALRAVFDRPGRLRFELLGPLPRLVHVSAIDASPGDAYTELTLDLPVGSAGRRVRVSFEDEKGQPTPWVSCHYWFSSRSIPR
jgi:hypothetical protein